MLGSFDDRSDAAHDLAMAEGNLDPCPDLDPIRQRLGHQVVELLAQRDLEGHTDDHRPPFNGRLVLSANPASKDWFAGKCSSTKGIKRREEKPLGPIGQHEGQG